MKTQTHGRSKGRIDKNFVLVQSRPNTTTHVTGGTILKSHVFLLAFLAIATVISSAQAATPISKYMGDWVEGKKYQPGQVVSLDEKSR